MSQSQTSRAHQNLVVQQEAFQQDAFPQRPVHQRKVQNTALRGQVVPAPNRPSAGQLTIRGRRVVAILALLPMMGALTLIGVHKAEAVGTAPTTKLIAVQPGDTLWDIAVQVAPDQDPRKTMWDIAQLNHMSTSDLHSGQPLIVPNP